ncbi:TRAP transporter large permease [Paraglaciecola chathamensis]|uniref:TRAP transporter large permease protein n=1 Tax=Paraglaciecola agarilytica NO2 TaxID=1125747 RepID=A0ABQ0I3X6_9ALTE|nr:TRAP transporter large permease subunit [Paraglaciecola agarilytica]GAC03764.1 TRAP-T family transporter, DctM (12 TMs) subunit [Paraglaciecola agarilytica NO2]
MSDIAIGSIALATAIIMIGFRVNIGLALGLTAIVGIYAIIGSSATLAVVKLVPYEFAASWELSAIPMFLLMGNIVFHSGMTDSLFSAARVWMSRLPGGLAIATNFACAGFASASGSSLATTISMGRIAIPEMRRYGYDLGLATGVIAAAGTLGSLIPPSILLVLYGIFAKVSVTKLFVAAIIPGIMTALIYSLMIMIRCKINPSLAPMPKERVNWSEKLTALRKIWPLPVLIFGVIGSIYSGIATATEAGALGAAVAFLIALIQGRLTLSKFRISVVETVATTGALFFIALGAVMMVKLMAFSSLPNEIASFIMENNIGPWQLLAITIIIFLIMGCLIDPMGMMLLALPVFLPMFQTAGFDMIWFGILIVKFVEIGLLTPPLGLNVFAVKSIEPDIPLGVIFRGVSWFIVCEAIVVAILCIFPWVTQLL